MQEKKVIELKDSKKYFINILSNGCYAYNKHRQFEIKGCMCNSSQSICYFFNKFSDSLEIFIDPDKDNIDNAMFWYKGKYYFFVLKDEYIDTLRKMFNELEGLKNNGCCDADRNEK